LRRQITSQKPDWLKKLTTGAEPAELAGYVMQARQNAVYHRGTGVLDLGQFRQGFGRHLVENVVLPDHHVYLNLDEYLVAANRTQLGFSATSEEIADHLLDTYPARDVVLLLAQLNRIREIPDHLEKLRLGYLLRIPGHAALRMHGLTTNPTEPRQFLARQPILIAMRAALLRNSHGVPNPRMPIDVAAVMLTHAVAAGLNVIEDGVNVWEGLPGQVLMEVVCNASFNSTEDLLARLDRMWRVYFEHGEHAANPPSRRPFSDLGYEALGADIGAIVVLGLLLNQSAIDWRWPQPVMVPKRFVSDARPEDLDAFLRYVSADEEGLRARLAGHSGPWGFLPFEQSPVLVLEGQLLVLDQEFLERRLTTGLFWEIGESERRNHGGNGAWRAWSKAHGQAVEAAAREQISALAPRLPEIGTGRDLPTYFTDKELIAAYPATRKRETLKQSDCAVWTGECWLIFEIVMHDLQIPTRQGRDLDEFRDDAEKMVMKKVRQLNITAVNLGSDGGAALLGYRPSRVVIQPVLIQGGHFPLHPATTAFIDDQLKRENLLNARDGRVRRLAIIGLEELEGLEAISQQGESLVPLFDEWQKSERRAFPLKNFLVSRGRHERPDRLTFERLRELLGYLSNRIKRSDPPNDESQPSVA
jgi:hypothetical protein